MERATRPRGRQIPGIAVTPEGISRRIAVAAVVLATAVVAVYVPTLYGDFMSTWDDGAYVLDNPRVQELSPSSVAWMFSNCHVGNWHPLTWLSHAVDFAVYGVDRPWGHHLTSILLHALNAALVFLVLQRLTGRPWPAAVVAALWALHPLRVESVSWISQRKDVLCAAFFLAAIRTYAAYVDRAGRRRYLVVVLAFAAALMSKPMPVTLPCILLLLDFWPLKRLNWRAVLEKIPLFVLSACGAVITLIAQSEGGAIKSFEWVTPQERFANVLLAPARYLGSMVWPINLSPLYPLARDGGLADGPWMLALGGAVLVAVSAVAVILARRRPYLLVGWLWFLGMLVPVIGVVQVGVQALADRYTYLPMIGVLAAVVWLAADVARHRPAATVLLAAAAAVSLVLLVLLTVRQERVWKTNLDLWRHVVESYPRNALARFNLGLSYWPPGPPPRDSALADQALACYRQAVELRPDWVRFRGGLADALSRLGRYDEAIAEYRTILSLEADRYEARLNLAVALQKKGDLRGAVGEYDTLLQRHPDIPQLPWVHENLAHALADLGRTQDAEAHRREAERLRRRGGFTGG